MAPPRDDFGAVRPIRRFNRLTQALLAIGLAVTVNYLASQTEFRFRQDLTWDHRHSLAAESAETVRVAGRKSPVGDKQNRNWVRAMVLSDNFSEGDTGLRSQLVKLLEAYKLEASRAGGEWFNILQVSNGLNQEALSEVAARHGPPGRNIGLILTCGTRAKFVTLAELVELNAAKVVTFRGEEAVTAALLEVTEDRLSDLERAVRDVFVGVGGLVVGRDHIAFAIQGVLVDTVLDSDRAYIAAVVGAIAPVNAADRDATGAARRVFSALGGRLRAAAANCTQSRAARPPCPRRGCIAA
jgi:hypothetical protein